MPQVFQVLKCFKCLVFQVHQTKKSNKFICKMCGEKQSIKRHYGVGNGRECRLHVQKLNGIRGEIDEQNEITPTNTESEEEIEPTQVSKPIKSKPKSKWSNYIDAEKDENELKPEEPMFLGNTEVVLEVPAKRSRFDKPKAAVKTKPQNSPWNITPVTQNDIIPVTDNFFSESKDLQIIELNDKDAHGKVDTPLIDKSMAKDNAIKPMKNNKQSKWAQFTEHEDDKQSQDVNFDNINCVNSNREILNEETFELLNNYEALKVKDVLNDHKGQNIFSMCDESDLDNILDI